MKLAVVGAGSTYTPEVIDGIVRLRDLLHVEERRHAAARLLARGRFDDTWPASIVHEHEDAEIWLDREALP